MKRERGVGEYSKLLIDTKIELILPKYKVMTSY